MRYKIVVDSCCELPSELKKDSRFEIVSLGLEVGDYQTTDDESFDQADFLKRVAACPTCPKSSCPSPEKYMEAYHTEAEHVYVVTLSANLSGSNNSAELGKKLYEETYGKKDICIIDSCSASCGETQIALKAVELEEKGIPFADISQKLYQFRDDMHTYFVLDNLETLRKNGRLSKAKALVASTLSIKPVMGATNEGEIVQLGQSIGMKKALQKMADMVAADIKKPEEKTLMITHCNAPERAETVKNAILAKAAFSKTLVMDTAGISSMYANNGGVIIAV